MAVDYKKEEYVLEKPILGWKIGEKIIFDPEWGTYEVRGEEFSVRSTVGEGEIVMLLNFLRANQIRSILMPTGTKEVES